MVFFKYQFHSWPPSSEPAQSVSPADLAMPRPALSLVLVALLLCLPPVLPLHKESKTNKVAATTKAQATSTARRTTTKARAQSHHAMQMELGAMLHQLSGKLLRLGDNRNRRTYMKDPLADGGELRMMEGLEKMANQVEKGMPISRVMTENARDSTNADRAAARGGGVAEGMRFKGAPGWLCRDRVCARVV